MSKLVWGCGCAVVICCVVVSADSLCAQTSNTGEAAARRIAEVLSQPLRRRISYAPEQLDIIFAELQEEYQIPVMFDKAALDEVAISPEAEVSIDLDNVSLRAALNLMFREPGLEDLCYVVEDEVLMITTEEVANAMLVTRVYSVDDLLVAAQSRLGSSRTADAGERLIEVLVATIEHDSWMENGTGDGEAQYYPPGMLVVSQTRYIHEQIETLLAQMRATKQAIVNSGSKQTELVATTQGFTLDVSFGGDREQEQQHLVEAIKRSVQWSKSGGSNDDFWIKVLAGRLVVRHLPAVLAQVETVLVDMEMLSLNRYPRGEGGIGCHGVNGGVGNRRSPDLAEDATAGDDGC